MNFLMGCSQKMDLTLLSDRNYFLYTPLLPAAATGTVEERSIVEPVRRIMAGKVGACVPCPGKHNCWDVKHQLKE